MVTAGEQTVPPKLISSYDDIIKNLGENYNPIPGSLKKLKKSGVYIDREDGSHYFSFHTIKKRIKNGEDIVIPRKIHLKIYREIDGEIIEIIIELRLESSDDGKILLVPKDSSRNDFDTFVKAGSVILQEINNINDFLQDFKGRFIDKSKPVPSFNLNDPEQFPGLNKYLEYKLKYFLLKSLFEK